MQQSPLKSKEYQELEEEKKDLITQLQYLFTFYASKSNRHNYRQLNHKFFIQMVNKLIGRESDPRKREPEKDKKGEEFQKKCSIIYYSKGVKEGVTFQQFLNFIPNLAITIHDSTDKQQATKLLLDDLIQLYSFEVQEKLKGKIINMNYALTKQTKFYIGKLINEFNKIYKAYFPHELNNNLKNNKYEDESLKCYFEFLKDFEILPKLTTAGQAYMIFRQISKQKGLESQITGEKEKQEYNPKGSRRVEGYTLGKFIYCLIAISSNCYRKLKQYDQNQQVEQNQKQILKTLLEYIEMTKAYKKQRHLKQTNESFSFIFLEEYPKEVSMKTIKINNTLVKEPKGNLEFINILKSLQL